MPNIKLETKQNVINEIMNGATQKEVTSLRKIALTSVSYIWMTYLTRNQFEIQKTFENYNNRSENVNYNI